MIYTRKITFPFQKQRYIISSNCCEIADTLDVIYGYFVETLIERPIVDDIVDIKVYKRRNKLEYINCHL